MTDLQFSLIICLVLFTIGLAEIKEEQKWEEKCRFEGKMTIFHSIVFAVLNAVNTIMGLVVGATILLLPFSLLFG